MLFERLARFILRRMSATEAVSPPPEDQPVCFECGGQPAHRAHVVPRVAGGTKTVLLCESCHGKSHDLDFHNHSGLVKEGIRKAKVKGRVGGTPPFGYENVGKRWEECPREQYVLGRIATLRCAGKTYAQIAEELNAVPSLRGRGGRLWTWYMLINVSRTTAIQCRERAQRMVLVGRERVAAAAAE